MNIAEKLTDLYLNELPKTPLMLPYEEALAYYERLLMNGNVITYVQDGELLGFIEFWRLSYEQWGRICANLTLTHDENLTEGPVCLISGMWIAQTLRNGETFLYLGRTFLEQNKDAQHFAAMQAHKHHKPLQIYSREDVLKHYRMEK